MLIGVSQNTYKKSQITTSPNKYQIIKYKPGVKRSIDKIKEVVKRMDLKLYLHLEKEGM